MDELPLKIQKQTDPVRYDRLRFQKIEGLVRAAPLRERLALYERIPLASASLRRRALVWEMMHGDAIRRQTRHNLPEALEIFRQLVGSDPRNGRWYKDLAVCEFLYGRTEEAVSHLQTAIRLDPASLEAHMSLGAVYASQDRLREAFAVYDAATSTLNRDNGDRDAILKLREEVRLRIDGSIKRSKSNRLPEAQGQ